MLKPLRKLVVQVDDISLPSSVSVVEVPVLLPHLNKCQRNGDKYWKVGGLPHLIREHCSEVEDTSSLPPSFPKPETGIFCVIGELSMRSSYPDRRTSAQSQTSNSRLVWQITFWHFQARKSQQPSWSGCFFCWIEKWKIEWKATSLSSVTWAGTTNWRGSEVATWEKDFWGHEDIYRI